MCDEHTAEDGKALLWNAGSLSRRGFGVMSTAALAACMSSPANPQEVSERDVMVTTPDGVADAYFAHPSSGRHPGVIMWPDALGLRPAKRLMARRLAQSGYAVLVVNPYYRREKAPVVADGASFFNDTAARDKVMGLMRSLTPQTQATDAKAFVAFLDAQPAVDTQRGIGAMGYCMGGPIVLRTAATVPDRVRAGASFHGASLVTQAPDSPHLLVPQMKANVLIAVAQDDDEREPDAKNALRQAFAGSGLSAEIEVYPAQHGWCPPDMPMYDQAQAERAWERLLALFGAALA